MNIYIASSRMKEIGDRCIEWASVHMPCGHQLSDDINHCDIFISVLYDTLLTREYIEGRSCFNFHPGLLPDYRGSGVYSWVLMNKEKETGITLHQIDRNIDTGLIIDTRSIAIGEYDTAETLFWDCMDLLFDLFVEYFPRILTGSFTTRPNEGGRLYLHRHLEEAKDISNIVKAFTFAYKESAYWYDSKGIKHEVCWK